MANQNDSFIDEVTDELRRDRFFAALRRYGLIVLLGIFGIIGGAVWWEMSRSQNEKAAQQFGDAVLQAESASDPAAALAAIDTDGSTGRTALAGLLTGGAQLAKGDHLKAAEDQLALAGKIGNSDPILRDLALLKAVMAAGADMDPATRDASLTELSQPGRPFELLALEQKAVALIEADRSEDAVTLIRQIQNKDGLSEGLRGRLAELMITLGVEPTPEASNPALTGAPTN